MPVGVAGGDHGGGVRGRDAIEQAVGRRTVDPGRQVVRERRRHQLVVEHQRRGSTARQQLEGGVVQQRGVAAAGMDGVRQHDLEPGQLGGGRLLVEHDLVAGQVLGSIVVAMVAAVVFQG